jgi:hypothetical protein
LTFRFLLRAGLARFLVGIAVADQLLRNADRRGDRYADRGAGSDLRRRRHALFLFFRLFFR